MNSRIEIYDSKGEKTVIQPPTGYEFTGAHRTPRMGEWYSGENENGSFTERASLQDGCCVSSRYILRPLPTAKEQRAEKLKIFLYRLHTNHTQFVTDCSVCNSMMAEVEAIYAPYLKDPEC